MFSKLKTFLTSLHTISEISSLFNLFKLFAALIVIERIFFFLKIQSIVPPIIPTKKELLGNLIFL